MDFQTLKYHSSERLNRIQLEMRKNSHTRNHTKLYKQVREAIDGTGLEDGIDACNGYNKKCGSIFCEGCCDRKIEHLRTTISEHFNKTYSAEEAIRKNGRYVTVLQDVVGVDFDDEKGSIAAVQNSVKRLRKNLKRVRRIAREGFNQSLWMRGSIHLEMLNFRDWQLAEKFGSDTAKQRTLQGFVDTTNINSERQILVHAHLVIDINGMSDPNFRKIWDEVFDRTSRQVHRQKFYRNIQRGGDQNKHSLDDAWKGISRYAYNWGNARLKFANNWGSGRNQEIKKIVDEFLIEVMDDDKTDQKMNIQDTRFLVMAYQDVSGPNHKGLSLSWHGNNS